MTHAAKVRAALMSGAIISAVAVSALAGTLRGRGWTHGDTDTHVTPYNGKCDAIVKRYLGPQERGQLKYDAYANMLNELGKCNKR